MSNYTLTTTDKRSSRAGCAVVEDNDQGPLTTVVEKYEKDRSDLVRGMAFYYAPHLADRAFWTQRWWEKRQGWPEAHMFKYLLIRSFRTGIFIFSDEGAPPVDHCKRKVEEYNSAAELLWRSPAKLFNRQQACEGLLSIAAPELKLADTLPPKENHKCFPASIEEELDKIFHQHYDTVDKYFLFGRADDEAYKVQDAYALAVASLLGCLDDRYEARVHLCLRATYGHGAPLPLLSGSSITAMWEVCREQYYQSQISLLHGWFEPLSKVPSVSVCPWAESLHGILRPKHGARTTTLISFYKSLMEWSPTLRRVVLLSSYVGPEPQVASFVREQLIAVDERATIVEAILDARAGNWVLKSIYDFLLQRTHLDLKTKLFLDRDGMDNLVEGMFDAALVGRLQALRLNCYSDIHEARSLIERFVSKCNGGSASAGSLWWDGVHPSRTAHTRWLSTRLEEDKDFELVLTDWLLDGERLQVWLDSCEESPGLVNNRDSLDDHVFATEVATQIMGLAKGMGFDKRRRAQFSAKPTWFINECETLGLFQTRMPGFTQLFFHNFTEHEVQQEKGQSLVGGIVSRRAASEYFRSRVQLKSKSAVSEIWYHFLETNSSLFYELFPCTPGVAITPPSIHVPLHPSLIPQFVRMLRWKEMYGTPEPVRNWETVETERGLTTEVALGWEWGHSSPAERRVVEEGGGEEARSERLAGNDDIWDESTTSARGVLVDGRGRGGEGLFRYLEDWPMTASGVKGPSCVKESIVPSSVPEERELRTPPTKPHRMNGVTQDMPEVGRESPGFKDMVSDAERRKDDVEGAEPRWPREPVSIRCSDMNKGRRL